MNRLNLLLAALLAPVLPCALPAQDAPPWRLLPAAVVDGSGVYLDQLVAESGASNPVPHLRLTRSPQPGQTFSFSRDQVASMAVMGTTSLPVTNWSGAASVRVSRRLRPLDDTELTEMLTASLQKDYVKNQGELEMTLTRPWATLQVPDEPLTVKVTQMPGRGVSPTFILTFELWDGKEKIGSWQTTAKASIWRDIPVAHSTLERGRSLKDADVTMQRADVLVEKDAYLGFPVVNEALELSENVPTGRAVLNRMVRVRPVILRGQLVEGVFQDGALGISLMVETLEDGTLGQIVKVRNPKTKRELFGKVESEQIIKINL